MVSQPQLWSMGEVIFDVIAILTFKHTVAITRIVSVGIVLGRVPQLGKARSEPTQQPFPLTIHSLFRSEAGRVGRRCYG